MFLQILKICTVINCAVPCPPSLLVDKISRPPVDDWDNVVVAPKLMHKALLLGDEEY